MMMMTIDDDDDDGHEDRGIREGIADDGALVDWVTSSPPIGPHTQLHTGSQHTHALSNNINPSVSHFVASSEEVIYKNSLPRQSSMSLKKCWWC